MSFENGNTESFESKMQRLYVGPLYETVTGMERAVTDLESRPELKADLLQERVNFNEMPESWMNEDELKSKLEKYQNLVSELNNKDLSNDPREELIRARLV